MPVLDVAVAVDAPVLDRIHVIEEPALEGPALRDKLLFRGLGITGLVGGAARDDRRRAVPYPWIAKTRLGDRQDRLLERGEMPSLSTIRGHLDARDPSASAPGESRHFVEARTGELHLARGKRDHGLRLHREIGRASCRE